VSYGLVSSFISTKLCLFQDTEYVEIRDHLEPSAKTDQVKSSVQDESKNEDLLKVTDTVVTVLPEAEAKKLSTDTVQQSEDIVKANQQIQEEDHGKIIEAQSGEGVQTDEATHGENVNVVEVPHGEFGELVGPPIVEVDATNEKERIQEDVRVLEEGKHLPETPGGGEYEGGIGGRNKTCKFKIKG